MVIRDCPRISVQSGNLLIVYMIFVSWGLYRLPAALLIYSFIFDSGVSQGLDLLPRTFWG